MKTVLVLSCLLLIAQAEDPDQEQKPLQYLHIGDGSSLEFEFPQNTRGVIVISSVYRSSGGRKGRESLKQTVRVRSLDPDVISVLNVTDGGRAGAANSYVISIRSGVPGTAPLLIQLLDLDRDSEPVLIEERSDYSIRVAAGEDDPAARLLESGGLSHFSENPILFALLPLIFVNKCAFGCKVEVEVLLALLKRPVPLLLGVAGQFLIMPLYGYGLSRLAALPKALSLGLVITCSAPGGGGGYLYSLLLGGDVTLAISMTLVSTVVATAAMPLSSAFYGWLLGVHAALHVPFVKILGTLLFIAIPISLGMLVKLRLPAVTRVLLTLIRPFSFVLIVGGIFMAYQMGSSILANVRGPVIAAGLTVPVFGLLLGLAMARLAGLAAPQRRTVSIEVGVQNSLLALAVMQLSFQRTEADYASQAPFLVALSSTTEMLLLVLAHAAHRRLCLTPASRTPA
ncbi:P3 protein [Rhinichthys klamathensis goyatoka]|uniref:P3 protein n=1 Tax=Rhinichthys klamathensis goyatoka TaxID=3034132 RepID=UPI0024B55F25|nr:P3 protein [Rhinichthys klamathensis goyatoka]